MDGGITESRIERIENEASKAPAAEIRCPVSDFVELI